VGPFPFLGHVVGRDDKDDSSRLINSVHVFGFVPDEHHLQVPSRGSLPPGNERATVANRNIRVAAKDFFRLGRRDPVRGYLVTIPLNPLETDVGLAM
jgi:hypothetical protein